MTQMNLRKVAIATSTFACATLLSFSWSEQLGVSLSVESAQARVGRPLTPVSVAGVARRQNRRAYRYDAAGIAGPEAVNYAGLAGAAGTAAVAGTAAAVAATQPLNWGWGGRPYGGIGPSNYYGYGYGGLDWKTYAARNSLACTPGTTFKDPDGRRRLCQ